MRLTPNRPLRRHRRSRRQRPRRQPPRRAERGRPLLRAGVRLLPGLVRAGDQRLPGLVRAGVRLPPAVVQPLPGGVVPRLARAVRLLLAAEILRAPGP
jgi:hypothetical protein